MSQLTVDTDLKPDNILIIPKPEEKVPLVRTLLSSGPPEPLEIITLPEAPHEYAIMPSEPLMAPVDFATVSVALTDFSTGACERVMTSAPLLIGALLAVWRKKGPQRGKVQSLPMRAPEVLLDAPWDCEIDMWAFACLVSPKLVP